MVRQTIDGRRRCDHYDGCVRCNAHAEEKGRRCVEHREAATYRAPARTRPYALERQKALFEGDHVDKTAANAIANYTQDPLCLKASLAPFDLEPHEAEHVANRADLAMRAYAASMLRWLASSHPETLQARFELRARKLEEPNQ